MFRAPTDRLFAELFPAGHRGSSPQARAPVDVYIAESDPPSLVVELAVAGVDPGEVDISLHEGVLSVRGTRRRDDRNGRRHYQHAEIPWGPFERRIRLAVAVDETAAQANFEQGILRVRGPLRGRPPAQRIEITVDEQS